MKSILALSATAALFASSALANSHDSHDRQALHRRAAERQANWVRRNKPVLLATPNTTAETDVSSAAPVASSDVTPATVLPTYEGTALWFEEGGNTGACGKVNTDDDLVVGLSDVFWPNTGVISEYCGKQMTIRNTDNNKTVTVTIADASGKEYTTLTRAAFLELSPLRIGMIPIEFQFVDASVPVPSTLASSTVASAVAPSTDATPATEGVFTSASQAVKAVAASPVAAAVESTSSPVTTAVPTVTAAPTSTVDSAAIAAASKASAEAAAEASEEAAKDAAASSKAAAAAAASREAIVLAAQHSSDAAEAASSSRAAAAAASSRAAAEAEASSSAAAAAASSRAAAEAAASSQAAAAAASSKAAAQAAASQEAAAAAASAKAAAAPSSSVYSGGIATFFFQNGVAGNCGKVNSDSTPLVALPTRTYAGGKYCGQTVTIKRMDSGKTITALVADSCPTCENDSCLDLSVGAFQGLGGTVSEGVFDIQWWFN
ncbi:hypothetical protein JCM11251_003996 [Rhodosporidiobolus azoricus]